MVKLIVGKFALLISRIDLSSLTFGKRQVFPKRFNPLQYVIAFPHVVVVAVPVQLLSLVCPLLHFCQIKPVTLSLTIPPPPSEKLEEYSFEFPEIQRTCTLPLSGRHYNARFE